MAIKVTRNLASRRDAAAGVAIKPAGRTVAAGTAGVGRFALASYLGEPSAPAPRASLTRKSLARAEGGCVRDSSGALKPRRPRPPGACHRSHEIAEVPFLFGEEGRVARLHPECRQESVLVCERIPAERGQVEDEALAYEVVVIDDQTFTRCMIVRAHPVGESCIHAE